MKKIYLPILLILFGWISSVQAVDITIQVDINGVSDYYSDGDVWIMMDNTWTEWYIMTDENSDGIFEYIITKDAGMDVYYKFAYQNGPDPDWDYVEETVPDDCSEANGLRMIIVPGENTTLPAVSFGSCFEAGITIRVDLREITDLYEGGAVWVYMDDNWEEYYDMMHYADDIYYYTLQKDEGTIMQYSFAYQNGPDPDYDYTWEIVPVECANANGYRELMVPAGDTLLPTFLYQSCSEYQGEVTTFTTTFSVDMRELPLIDLYEGGSVWLNINEWTEYYDMTDEDMDDIYTYDYVADSGTMIIYKFSYQSGPDPDNDYTDESVPGECSSSFSETNRDIFVDQDSILPAFMLGACGVYGDPGTEKVMVTFSVELAGDSVATNGMWMVTKSPWSWREQIHTTGDVYASTVRLFKGQSVPYTYVYGGKDNWDGEESVPEECNFGTVTAPERLFAGAEEDSIMPVIPFGECLTGDLVSVTFRVDMKDVNMAEGDVVWVWASPGYEEWPEMWDEDEDGIYELELNFEPGTEVAYIYSYGTWEVYDIEVVPTECSDEAENRFFTVGDDAETLPAYIYGTCDERPDGIDELNNMFSVYPNPARDFINVELNENPQDFIIQILDLTGQKVAEIIGSMQRKVSIPVEHLSQGFYIIQIKTETNIYSRKIVIEH